MAWTVTADVERFDEASEWFRSRFPVTEDLANVLGDYAGPRAWTIAGVSQLDVLLEVFESLQRAIDNGTPYGEWKREIESTLTAAWGSPNAHRIETIFRNSTMQAYNAGRWRQMQHPVVRQLRPFIMFDGVRDSRQSPICRKWDGTIRPIDDPVWEVAHPQMHHRCRSQLRTLRKSEAVRRGITDELPDLEADEGFGKAPTEAQWKPDPSKYPPELFSEFQLKRTELERTSRRPRLDD